MDPTDLFPGFEARTLHTGEVKTFLRLGGPEAAPALVCLHGFGETHVAWARVAAKLAARFRLVLPDLRGSGWSGVAEPAADHAQMGKRALAEDVVRLMEGLGHVRFALLGDDVGARVGHRLALDQPGRLDRLILLDATVPATGGPGDDLAGPAEPLRRGLARPAPIPETEIGRDPRGWLDAALAASTASGDLAAFGRAALGHYHASFAVPERVRATCEEARAAAGIDRAEDVADFAAGRRIAVPTLVGWGAEAARIGSDDARIAARRAWAAPGVAVETEVFACGGRPAEEAPAAVAARVLAFLG